MAKDRIADLYALPLDEFTGARNARAKELADGGDKAAAAEVRALKKPSVPAWAVDQVARAHPKELEELFDAGEQLRDAQKKLMRSGDSAPVREAQTAERKAVKVLVDRGRTILAEAGYTPTESTLERVADTFYATTVDDEGREHVRKGTLVKELKRAGFGDVGGLTAVPAIRETAKKQEKRSAQLEKESAKLKAAADEAEQRAADAEADAEELLKRAEDTRTRAGAAREKARFARRHATEARREAEKAARRADRPG